MCYLCLQENPFGIKDLSKSDLSIKRARAKEIKELLKFYRDDHLCIAGALELDKLKEEQYKLSREI